MNDFHANNELDSEAKVPPTYDGLSTKQNITSMPLRDASVIGRYRI